VSTFIHFFLDGAASVIQPPDEQWSARARARLDSLTKPLGSLGRLEDLAAQLVSIQRERFAEPLQKAVYLFAADHGITAEGVSAYSSEVTRQMVLNFLAYGAAISILSRLHHVSMHVIDVGVNADFEDVKGLMHHKVRKGSRNMLLEAAMSEEEMLQALVVGWHLATDAKLSGHTLLAVGEMGIGNTTAASAITSVLCHEPVSLVTGRGTGLDATGHAHKCQILEAVIEMHFGSTEGDMSPTPLDVLRCVGGLEIAAMVGFILGACRHGVAVVIDGFISTAAAAIACAIAPNVRGYLFAGHQSEEPGHRVLLAHLGLAPILRLNMRLGEGTGAVLAMPILESALDLYNKMATFAAAGITEASA
jgi:nicotinate-nucleotide--dimethylbenzimidazole phosphoribosyltransferase